MQYMYSEHIELIYCACLLLLSLSDYLLIYLLEFFLFCLSSFFLVVWCSVHVIVCVLLNTVLSLVFLSCGAVLCARDCLCTAQYCSVSRLSFLWCGALYT